MKLVSCYIRSFGTLKDLSIDFTSGLNQLLCDNGMGKTTLVSFIKAMLYGLDYKQGRVKFYERQQYMPWNEKSCGGSLVIELGGKKYRIDREFGIKQTDDKFSLYDEDTMRESSDYGEDIGEKIFEVDKESFEKSLFFGQGSLSTGITNSLNTKMGNLSDMRDDMNKFDEAIKSIEKARQEYTKKGSKNKGKIALINEEIRTCEEANEQIPILESAIKDRKNGIEEKKKRIKELVSQKHILSEKIKAAGEKKEIEGIASAKREQLEKLLQDIKESEDFFGADLPEVQYIDELLAKNKGIEERKTRINEIGVRNPSKERVDFLSSVFAGEDAVTEEILEISQRDAAEIAKLRVSGNVNAMPEESEHDLARAREFFKDRHTSQDEIKSLFQKNEEINTNNTKLILLNERLENVNSEIAASQKSKGKSHVFLFLISAICIVISIIGGSFLTMVAGAIGAGLMAVGVLAGIIILIVGIILMIANKVSQGKKISQSEIARNECISEIETVKKVIEDSRRECLEFIDSFPLEDDIDKNEIMNSLMAIQKTLVEYERLSQLYEATKKDTAENTDALAELTMKLYTRLSEVASKYGYDLFNDHTESELLSDLLEDIKLYDEYIENISQIKAIEGEIQELNSHIDLFLSRYDWKDEKNSEQRLLWIKSSIEDYDVIKAQIKVVEEDLEKIKVNNDIEEQSLEEYQEQSRQIDEQHQPLVADVAKEEEELSRLSVEIEEKEEVGRRLLALKEQRQEMEDRVEVLLETKEYLEQARDEFLSVYMKPLRDGMDEYVSRFIPESSGDEIQLTLDMDLSIKLQYRGSVFSGDYLSEGYRDLAAMCARLALIDILYKDEKPPIYLDDPFTNLDDKKIQKALSLVKELSNDMQILYMTCHQSRALPEYNSLITL